jgi:probable HAF family extracellular repeat protein
MCSHSFSQIAAAALLAGGILACGELPSAAQVSPESAPRAELQPDPGFKIYDLGVLPGAYSTGARAISDNGVVVGWSGSHAFKYQNGIMTPLPTLPGQSDCIAKDLNNLGMIVGSCGRRPVMWFAGQVIDLGDLGGGEGTANAINESGVIVGTSSVPAIPPYVPDVIPTAFRWTSQTGMTRLLVDTPEEFPRTEANDSNDAGVIAGLRGGLGWPLNGYYPVRWTADGKYLAGLPGPLGQADGVDVYSRALAINNGGELVGSANEFPTAVQQAFQWSSPRVGAVLLDAATANDVSDKSRYVGNVGYGTHYFPKPYSPLKAFTQLTVAGKMVLLPGLSAGQETAANGVNRCGQVVGSAKDAAGVWHAALWKRSSCDP